MIEEFKRRKMQLVAKYLVNYCQPLMKPFIKYPPLLQVFPELEELGNLAELELCQTMTHRQVRDRILKKVKEFKITGLREQSTS